MLRNIAEQRRLCYRSNIKKMSKRCNICEKYSAILILCLRLENDLYLLFEYASTDLTDIENFQIISFSSRDFRENRRSEGI
jgi:hypothetical protein